MTIANRIIRVANSVAVNRDAAVAMSGGTAYDPEISNCSYECPELTPLPSSPQPQFRNLAGKQFGRIRVIGYGGSGGKGSKWICACWCGRFQKFSTQVLRKKRSDDNPLTCAVCNNTRAIRDFGKSSIVGKEHQA